MRQSTESRSAAETVVTQGASLAAESVGAQRPPKVHLAHVSLAAQDPPTLAGFYQELFGMEVVGGGTNGAAVFLASDPAEESHDLAFSRDAGLAHIALKVATLADLITVYRTLQRQGVGLQTQNHGVSLALYFRDPEGNLVEVYWSTGRTDFYLPVIRPLDLERPEAELRRLAEEQPSNRIEPVEIG
jgi:catechol 2,3-dioxygenase-like lactoylglutathione lyase family enzyme